MEVHWLEVTIGAIAIAVVLTRVLSRGAGWLSWRFWRGAMLASSVTMTSVLLVLSFQTVAEARPGAGRIPPWTVINHEIGLKWDAEQQWQVPVVGEKTGFFGKEWSPEEAKALVDKGKLTFQSRNCMECHTLLGNGAYYAPDLTRAWLDPWWETRIKPIVGAETREEAMMKWLMNPPQYPQGQRRMPNLNLTEEEAKALVAFLKWMSAIDTNGFPPHFGLTYEAR